MQLGPHILSDKWDHVSDDQKRAYLASKGMEVRIDDGRVWWLHAPGYDVTLGVPESEHEALWAAYDLIVDPPISREESEEFERALREEVRKRRMEQWERQQNLMKKRL